MRYPYIRFKAKVIIMMLICLVSFGCQGMISSVNNGYVKEMDRISINNNLKHNGLWQAEDLFMNYEFSIYNGRIDLSGLVAFENRIKYNFIIIKRFHLDAIFLDAQGKVLSVQGIISGSGLDSRDSLPFSRLLTLPDQAVSLAFSYSGEALEEGDHGGSPTQFWYYPIH